MAQNANFIDSKSFAEVQNKAKEIYSLFTDNEITLMADASEIDNAAYNAEDLDKAISGVEAKSEAALKPLEAIKTVLENIKTISIGEYFEKFELVFGQWQRDLIEAHDRINNIKNAMAEFEQHGLSTKDLNQELIDAESELNLIRDDMERATGLSRQLAAIWETILTDDSIDTTQKLVDRFRLSADQMATIKTQLVGVNTELDKANEKAQKANKEAEKNKKTIKGWAKDIFKVSLALAGVRSIYTSIRRAMSAYLAQNEELNNKLNACWYALGSLFAPALEVIVKLFQYVLSIVNAIAVGLGFAGINMKNFGKSATEAAKAQKKLAGFDEINDIGNSDSGDKAGVAVENPFTAWEDSKALTMIKEHAQEILAVVAGIVAALLLVKLGVNAIMATGIGLAVAGVISLIQDLVNLSQDPSLENLIAVFIDLAAIIVGVAVALGVLTGGWAIAAVAITAVLLFFKDDVIKIITLIADKVKEWCSALGAWLIDKITKIMSGISDLWNGLVDVVGLVWDKLKTGAISAWTAMWGAIKNICGIITSGVSNAFTSLKTNVVKGFTDIKTGVVNIFQSIWNTLKGIINSILSGVQGMANGVINGFNAMIRALNNLRINIPSWVPVYGGKSFGLHLNQISNITIPKLATGTNYVPEDQLAMIHKGEAVVPKKFNSETYFEKINNNNNEDVVSALNTLIEVVESKEFNAFISQKEIGQSAIKYINAQNRIMGGSVI